MSSVRKGNAGFTLLEVSFATGILLVSLGLAYGAVIGFALTGETADRRDAAMQAAASVMESIHGLSLESLAHFTPEETYGPRSGVSVTVEIRGQEEAWRSLPLAPDDALEPGAPIIVRVSGQTHTTRGHPLAVTLETRFLDGQEARHAQ